MAQQSLARRLLFPIALVTGLMVTSSLLYDHARTIQNPALHRGLAHLSAIVMFASIWLGAFIAHPIAFFRGAGYGERMLAGTATAMIWSATVLTRFIGIYSAGEFVFLFFHHLVLGAPVVSLLCAAISEIVCRLIARRKTGGQTFRVFAWQSTLTLAVSLALVVTMLWKGGHTYYYWYMDLYTKLFL
jgi:hypothetical protein